MLSEVTDWAQQPPTPMIRFGSCFLSALASWRWATKRSSAFSRIEQVLKRMRSASSRVAASAYPRVWSMPFIRSESCSFIWQPKVVTWNVFMARTACIEEREGIGGGGEQGG